MQQLRGHANGDGRWVLAQRRIADRALDAGDVGGRVAKGGKPRAKPRPFRSRADQTGADKTVVQQVMTQIKIQRVRIGQDQVFGTLRGKADGAKGEGRQGGGGGAGGAGMGAAGMGAGAGMGIGATADPDRDPSR